MNTGIEDSKVFLKAHFEELKRLDMISKTFVNNFDEVYKELMHLD